MIIGVLAIVKAGGAYVPLESDLPQERLMHMLLDSGSKILVTSTKQKKWFKDFSGEVIYVDDYNPDGLPTNNPNIASPTKAVGDIYIGGEGVVRGYFKQPALTAERFIAHPFKKGERLYKTGDLG
eukprot:gene18876-19204_t